MRLQGWATLILPMLALTLRRFIAQIDLTLTSLLGMTSAAVLIMGIPIYVDAAYNELLQAELSGPLAKQQAPFTFIIHRLGNESRPLTLSDIQDVDGYLTGPVLADALNLPQKIQVSLIKSDSFGLFAQDTADYKSLAARLANVQFGWISDLADHIDLVEGHFPTPALIEAAPIDVLITEVFALKSGIQSGEEYTAFSSTSGRPIQIPIRIVGIWRAKDPYSPFWFRHPESFNDALLVPQATFTGPIQAVTHGNLRESLWYFVVDSDEVRVSAATQLLNRILRFEQTVTTLLPDTFLTSPIDLLHRFQESARTLSFQLLIFSVPIFGLNLIFIGLTTGMSVQRRQGEIAVMRSRGATQRQVVGMAALEGALIALFAFIIALPSSLVAVRLAMASRSLLSVTTSSSTPLITLSPQALLAGLAALGCSIVIYSLLTIGAARHTIITFSWSQARQLRPPWWSRIGLDLLLLIPSTYGVYLLAQQDKNLLADATAPSRLGQNPFENPLLFLIPFLMIAGLTLLLIRVLPHILAILARLMAASQSVSLLFAVRHLARTPGRYGTPLALLTITLSLAIFLSATNQTLGEHLTSQALYQVGADLVLMPRIESEETDGGSPSTGAEDEGEMNIPEWYYVPMSDYLQIPGIEYAARVGRFPAVARQAIGVEGAVLGVDRAALASVAYWKPEFADHNLGALMNQLAQSSNAVLLPSDFMAQHALSIGDPLVVTVNLYGYATTLNLQVTGQFDLFPTWNPRWGPLFVLNLSHLFGQIGLEIPTSIWLKVGPETNLDEVRQQLTELNPHVSIRRPFLAGVAAEEAKPERQGLLGLLSVGILSAGLLATVGFFMYAIYSISRRSVELGLLRAMGLSAHQMFGYLSWELTILVAVSLVAGTRIGIFVSQLWIPYFKPGNSDYAQFLPMSVNYSWTTITTMYALFGLALILTLLLFIRIARQLRLFEVIKMGDV
ncbi:MAG: ABC transporter permease [Chloroflexota bacterium]